MDRQIKIAIMKMFNTEKNKAYNKQKSSPLFMSS